MDKSNKTAKMEDNADTLGPFRKASSRLDREEESSKSINRFSKSSSHGGSSRTRSHDRSFVDRSSDFDESYSNSGDTGDYVVEDYFLKFNSISGLRSLVLMQFQGQMFVVILWYLFFWYIIAMFSVAFAFGSPVHLVPMENSEMTVVLYTGDIIYFCDWLAMIVFKNIKWPEVEIHYQSRHGFILFVEFLSLIPLEPIYGALVKANVRIYYSLRLRYCLRLTRLFVFYKQSRAYVGNYSHIVHLCTYFAILTLIIITGSAVYYVTVCNEACEYADYNVLSTAIYVCTTTIIGGVGIKQVIGIKPSYVDSTLISIFSFVLALLFTSYFVCDTIHSMKPRFVQMNLYERYKAKIKEWKADTEWTTFHRKFENLIYEYCSIYWHKTRGESYDDYKGHNMPAILYSDLALDTTWVPLKHCHLFRNQDVYFIRAVADLMTHKFLCPGEVFYKKHTTKDKMFYIISGTVDALSVENGETPVISFSAGTVIGESCLVVSYETSVTIVSRHTTDVAVLSRTDLLRLASKFPREIQLLVANIKMRYERAKGFRALAEYQFEAMKSNEHIGVMTLKWLKYTLTNLLSEQEEASKSMDDQELIKETEEIIFCVKYLDLYVLKKDVGTTANLTFVKSTFPVVFRPYSLLLKVWFFAILGHFLILALTYPYVMVFLTDVTMAYRVFLVYINVIWVIDIYVKSSTAVSTKYIECDHLGEILMYNLTQFIYYLDIAAAIPTEMFMYILNGQISDRERVLCSANRLLKIYILEKFFDNLGTNVRMAVILNYIKFGVYFMLLCYYASMFFYYMGWFPENVTHFQAFLTTFKANTTLEHFVCSMFCAVEFARDMSLTPFPYVISTQSVTFFVLNMVSDMVLSLFMVACSISLEWILLMDTHCFNEFMRNVLITMEVFKFDDELKRRTLSHIDLQYAMTKTLFLFDNDLFQRLPHDLYVMTNGIYPGSFLKDLYLFYYLDDRLIGAMAAACNSYYVLRNETIKQFGENCYQIVILVEGMCRIQHLDGSETEAGTGSIFWEFESAFSIKSCITVTTLTNCRMFTLPYVTFKRILSCDEREYHSLMNTVNSFPYWEELDDLCATEPNCVVEKHVYKQPVEKNYRSFGYRLKKRTEPYYEIHLGFPKFTAPFKILLMRYTFYNNGMVVKYYEMYRCVCVLLYIGILPHSLVLGPNDIMWSTIRYIFDGLAMVDVYIRHHISYYDDKTKLEITHPWKTAVYYWKHAFAVDLLSCLPLEVFFGFAIKRAALWKINRLFQLYRVAGFIKFFFSRKVKGIWRVLIYIPILVLVLNFLAYEVLMLYCTYGNGTHKCLENSYLGVNWTGYTIYLYNMIFVTGALLGGNYYIVQVYTTLSIYVFFALSLLGLYVHVIITARTTAENLSVNRDLMAYQEAMQHLNHFWSEAKIDKKLKKEVVKHFDYMWEITRGKTLLTTFSVFRTYFKTDILSQVYGKIFENSTIFEPPNDHFFRALLFDAKHEIYLKTGVIYRVNDINDDVFLLLRGKVEVVGADLNRLASLEVGSVFGNIDHTPITRMTVSTVASGHVEVLRVSTMVLYGHLARFPRLLKHFKYLTRFDIDYLIEKRISKLDLTEREHSLTLRIPTQVLKVKFKAQQNVGLLFDVIERNIFLDIWDHILYAAYFFSYVIELYNLACFETHPICFVLMYFFDILNVIKIYLKFVTSYEDEYGRTVMVRGMIVRRYKREKLGFYFDLCTVLPIELISFAFIRRSYFIYVYGVCRINRLPRIVFTIVFFRKVTQKLTANVVLLRLGYLLLWIFLMQLNIGFILKLLDGRTGDTVFERMQLFGDKLQLVVDASRKVGTRITGTERDNAKYAAYIATLCASQIIHAVFMAESCAIILQLTHTQISYRQFIIFMKRYMKSESVSDPLRLRVINYVTLLWKNNKGVQFPTLLSEAPNYLKEGVLYSMFGILLMKHEVLKHCHKDLTRQICARMKTLVFFPGDNVVYIGDIDECMYFIYEGEVHALSEDSMYSEVVDEVLLEGDMFGLEQGLYQKTGHEYTYKCVKYSVLVYLRRNDWIHLLDFFPASKSMIIEDSDDDEEEDHHESSSSD